MVSSQGLSLDAWLIQIALLCAWNLNPVNVKRI